METDAFDLSPQIKLESLQPLRSDNTDWPIWGLTDDVRPAFKRGLEQGPVALVTITGLEGGGPRPVGSQMIVTRSSATGFLSGGCIESDVVLRARECLDKSANARLVYGRGSPWFDIQLLCGARIELLVETIEPNDQSAHQLIQLASVRRPAIWLTDGIRHRCIEADRFEPIGKEWFVRRYNPPQRLIVVGGDPISLAIAALGIQAGFQTYLIRPRGPSGAPPLDGLHYLRSDIIDALSDDLLDLWTYVAVCSHDIDRDAEVLQIALKSDAPYVGLLGSRRRLPLLKDRLNELNVTEKQLLRLRAPIGIDLGVCSQFEIAVSVLAEMIAVKNSI